MLKQIIDFLNLRIAALNYCEQLYCLCEIKGESGTEPTKEPLQRGANGEHERVDFDRYNGVGYWRLRGDVTTEDAPTFSSGRKRLTRTFPLRFVFAVPRDKVSIDDAYSFQRAAQSIEKVVTVQLGDLQNQLGAGRVTVAVNTEKHDPKAVWDEETDGTKQYEPKYELLYGALDMTVTVTADVACFVSECGDVDTDILHTFDFCKPTVVARLTDEQVACLETALCETPPTLCEQLADVTPDNVVEQVFDCLTTEAQGALLEAECVTPPCDPVTLDINGTNVGSEPSGGGFNINVTLDGTPSGAWDGTDTWEVTSDPCLPVNVIVNGDTIGTPASGTNFTLAVELDGIESGTYNGAGIWEVTSAPCDPATITINGDPYGTVASGATEDISVLSDVGNPVGSLVSGNWEVGNAHLRVNGTNVGNLEPEQTHNHYATINGTQAGSWHNPSQTWRMNVLQGGSPVGSLSGTDWIIPACPSAPSLAVSPSTATPAYGASVTITATPTSITPSSYTFTYQTDSIGTLASVTQAGNTLAITAKGYGAQTVTVTATDGSTTVGATCTITVAQMTVVTDFVTNTGISDATIIGAVRTLALKSDDKGIWSLTRAFYPFVGGTATTHKYNLKDPRDLDAAYRIVFAGGWTHNANGITGNGVNTSADSKIANSVLGQDSLCIGVYNRTSGTGQFDWTGSITPRTMFIIKFTTGNAFYDINNTANTAILTPAPSSELGCVMANRNSSEFTSVNYRGQTRDTTAVATTAPAATNLLLGAYSGGGGSSARNYAAAWVCAGLTQQQQTDLVNIVNEFQTTLGRNV